MAGIECKCGSWITNGGVPNMVQYHIFSDSEWLEFIDKEGTLITEFPEPKNDVWKCPNCQRIHIFSSEGVIIKTYILESNVGTRMF
ncbi:hypothetical protein ACI6Q2_07865 [Chitinophagaceae bacterium LWZ2-11]